MGRNRLHLHVLTAVSRPQNLGRVAASLARAAKRRPDVDVVWRWRFDLECAHVGGQEPKNMLLNEFETGWVYFLDDDTLMHPKLLLKLTDDPDVRAIVVSQDRGEEGILEARPENVRLGRIDIGQVLVRRELIGGKRIPALHYGDGIFLEEVLKGRPEVVFIPEVLASYNQLKEKR